ncbi:hypothetical protein, partial [Pseudomonas aeruginosa]
LGRGQTLAVCAPVGRRRSATGLPIRQLLDALPGLLGEPLAEVDDWRRTRWDALVMQAAMPDPRWMPGQ